MNLATSRKLITRTSEDQERPAFKCGRVRLKPADLTALVAMTGHQLAAWLVGRGMIKPMPAGSHYVGEITKENVLRVRRNGELLTFRLLLEVR